MGDAGKLSDGLYQHLARDLYPRYIGRHDLQLGNAVGRRCVMPFQQWMFQRPLRYYQSLSPISNDIVAR